MPALTSPQRGSRVLMLMARLLLSLSLATIDVQTISLVVRSAVGVIPPTADRQGWALQRAALSGLFPRETTLPSPVRDVCYPRLSHLWRIGRIPRWWSGRSRVLARTYDRPLRPSRWLIVTGVLTLWFHVGLSRHLCGRCLCACALHACQRTYCHKTLLACYARSEFSGRTLHISPHS